MKKVLLIFLSVLLSFSAVACKKAEQSSSSSQGAQPQESQSAVIVFNDFENQKSFNTVGMKGYLGNCELNDDKAYVTSGEKSMKLTVSSNPYYIGNGSLYKSLNHDPLGLGNYTNLNEISHICLDVYSEQEEDRTIGIQLIYEYRDYKDSPKSMVEWFTVSKGKNVIEYAVSRELIELDIGDVRFVEAIEIFFERGETDEVYYLDAFRMYKTKVPASPFTVKLQEDEICSFDYKWQFSYLTNRTYVQSDIQPIFEFNTEPSYTVSGSGGSLKVTFPAAEKNDIYYPAFYVGHDLMKLVDLSLYDDNDLLCVDVYSATPEGMDVFLLLTGEAWDTQEFLVKTVALSYGKWINFKISVGDLNAIRTKDNLTFKDTCFLGFSVGSKTWAQTAYFDNIRMEVVE